MHKHIIKSALFIIVVIPLFLLWRDLLNGWKSNTRGPNIGILPVEHETDEDLMGYSSGFVTSIYLSDFDVENSQATFLISVDYSRGSDQDGKFPILRNIVQIFRYFSPFRQRRSEK